MFRLLVLVLFVCALSAQTFQIEDIGATFATLRIRGAASACTLNVREGAADGPLHPDVTASVDTSRSDTITDPDGSREVRLGHQRSNLALAADTQYFVAVSGCATASLSFRTTTIPLGAIMPMPLPFDATKWNNADLPAIDWKPSGIGDWYVDPTTGMKLSLIHRPEDFGWVSDNDETFSYWAGGSGWTNPGNVLNGSTSTAQTNNTNPIFLYPKLSGVNPWMGTAKNVENIGVIVYAEKVSCAGECGVKVGIMTHPSEGFVGTELTLEATSVGSMAKITGGSSQTNANGAFPTVFPEPGFSGWGSNVAITKNMMIADAEPGATGGITNGVITIPTPSDTAVAITGGAPGHVPSSTRAGHHVWVDGATSACTSNGNPGICTVGSFDSTAQLTLVEDVDAAANTEFNVLPWGIRVQAYGGTVKVGLNYRMSGSEKNSTGTYGPQCGPTEETDADGVAGYPCIIPVAGGYGYLYFISNDGSVVRPIAKFWDSTLGGPHFQVKFSSTDSNIVYANHGSGLRKGVYTGDWKDSPWDGSDGKYRLSDGLTPIGALDEHITWTYAISNMATQVNTAYPAQTSGAYDPWPDTPGFMGVNGDLAGFYRMAGGGTTSDSGPCQMSIFKLSTGLVFDFINTLEQTGTPLAFSACHAAYFDPPYNPPILNAFGFAGNRLPISGNGPIGDVTFTADAGTDTLTATGHPFTVNGIYVRVSNSGGSLPGGLSATTDYYVVGRTDNTLQLSLTVGGAAVDITSAGSGTNKLNTYILHNGPYEMPIEAILGPDGSTWSTSIVLDYPRTTANFYNACPGGLTAEYTDFGAVTPGCVTFKTSGHPCNAAPKGTASGSSFDFEAFGACAWNASYAAGPDLRPGHLFIDRYAGFTPGPTNRDGDSEHFRVIEVTELTGGDAGKLKVVVQWNASRNYCAMQNTPATECYNCVSGTDQNTHPTPGSGNFVAMMMPGSKGSCNGSVVWTTYNNLNDASDKSYIELVRDMQGHTAIGDAGSGNFRYLATGTLDVADVAEVGSMPPLIIRERPALVKFGGVTSPIGSLYQQYFNHGQYGAPDREKVWSLAANAINPGAGSGGNLLGNGLCVGLSCDGAGDERTFTHVSGNVWQLGAADTVSYKNRPLIGWVGQKILKDVSGPGSNISTAADYSLCYEYVDNECATDAGTGTGSIYIKAPGVFKHDIDNPTPPPYDYWEVCQTGMEFATTPCIFSAAPVAGYVRQFRSDRANFGADQRLLTNALKPYGTQYPFWNATAHPAGRLILVTSAGELEGVRHTTLLGKLPAWEDSTSRRNSLGGHTIAVGSRPGMTHARVRFGYDTSFYCTERAEACVTDASLSPFAFVQSDSLTATSCSGGCTINVPAMPGRLLYYRIETYDGSAWSNGPTETAAP